MGTCFEIFFEFQDAKRAAMQRISFTDEDPPQDSIFALSLPQ